MRSLLRVARLCLLSSVIVTLSIHAQTQDSLVIRQRAMSSHPFTVVGEGGAFLGSQNGVFELWQNPVKILRDFRITAHLQDYDATLQMNSMAATIEVTPSETVITLAHAAIIVREHLLIDRTGKLGVSSALAYFEIEATRPADLVFSFSPELQYQWPAPNFGTPSGDWRTRPEGSGYVLATDNPGLFGVVAIPGTTPAPPAPYQERTRTLPLELHLHFDPKTDHGRIYPLLTAVSNSASPATMASQNLLLDKVLAQQGAVRGLKAANTAYYAAFSARTLSLTTPDPEFNDAFRWAEISIDQSRVRAGNELGLVAGWSGSDDTARPGFGWFFGRDTLWSLYAVNSYGDFELTRHAIDFLLARQRADGKMMHEYSQTAGLVDWANMPYLYASADATPLFLMQMEDYVRTSGDIAYLTAHWDNVRRAYEFIAQHRENGLYSNSEGTGWVEEWPGPRPHQEVYLAALDVQASRATARLAHASNDVALSNAADAAARTGAEQLAGYLQTNGLYAFSRNAGNNFDATQSIFPSVAWWDEGSGLPHADAMLDRWASSSFSVDWGIRSVPSNDPIYDPISYHHGSVWPLYTGWVELAEFRTGRTLQALERTRQTLALHRLQDPGAITEVISGEFFEPLSRSSSHQLWSSAMAITPVVRGMLGLLPDAQHHTLQLDPHLPASWDRISAAHVHLGNDSFDLNMSRRGETLEVETRSTSPTLLCLAKTAATGDCKEPASTVHKLLLPLPPVEVDYAVSLPAEGERSAAMHFLHQSNDAHSLTLDLEAPAGTTQILILQKNRTTANVQVEGAEVRGDKLMLQFPAGKGYVPHRVTFRW